MTDQLDAAPEPTPIRTQWDNCEGLFAECDGSHMGRYKAGELLIRMYEELQRELAQAKADLDKANEITDLIAQERDAFKDGMKRERSAREEAEREGLRLNEWANGMTDTVLKERATADAYQKELKQRAEAAEQRLATVEAALTELVRLKQIKKRMEAGEIYEMEAEDYALNKDAAWVAGLSALAKEGKS